MIVLADRSGTRRVPFAEFITGPKQNACRPGEVIVAAEVAPARGPQEFVKVGTRNAMVISVASVALVVDTAAHTVACALGSVGPTIIRATEAEQWIAARVDWERGAVVEPGDRATYAAMVADAARPIDDHRSTAAYRRRGDRGLRPAGARAGARMTTATYRLSVNGTDHDVADGWIGESLLYVLRERLGLPGAKNACEQGRVWLVLGARRRRVVLRVPRARGDARRRRGHDGRSASPTTPRSPTSSRRSSPPAPCSAASARPGS